MGDTFDTDDSFAADAHGPFVVIGGDAAGMSAASKAKREAPDLEVVVFERGEWVSYAACGMPYYLKGDVDTLDELVAMRPETFREKRDIDLRTNHDVVDIDPDSGVVVAETDGDRIEQPYGSLLIGTGARAVLPPFDGMGLDGVFTLRGLDEAAAIDEYIETHDPGAAAIVGGGYVGIETAEALTARGIDVSVFEMESRILQPFAEPTARAVEAHVRDRGVDLRPETAVRGFETGGNDGSRNVGNDRSGNVGNDRSGNGGSGGDDAGSDDAGSGGRVDTVVFEGGTAPAELVIVGVGVAPNVELAESAGVEVGPTGAIATDEYGRTNLENVYAAGDCAEAEHVVTGEPDHVPLALTANRAGRAVGTTVGGAPTPVGRTAGTAILKAFDLEAARTGIVDPERARAYGFDPVSVTVDAPTRAHYYPGGSELSVTLVADRGSERVLGASLVGEEGAKRIDTVATALESELTVAGLRDLDLAYAPPFSPVWDPILTAAKVLDGKLTG